MVPRHGSLRAFLTEPREAIRIRVLGVFDDADSPRGAVVASLQLVRRGEVEWSLPLTSHFHLGSADTLVPRREFTGDGISIESLGTARCDGVEKRLDLITVDLPDPTQCDEVRVSIVAGKPWIGIFRIEVESTAPASCPFRQASGKVSLSEVGSILRLSDRNRFAQAVGQMEAALRGAADLDEARSQALTFLAVVTASSLEAGGGRELHRLQLQVARAMDREDDLERIIEIALDSIHQVADPLFAPVEDRAARLIDRAVEYVDRNFAKRISDAVVARELGLSTSHFRYLFRESLGMPFHQYVITSRLERARKLLRETDGSIGEIALEVGFSNVSHFSKAFAQRFEICPSRVRRSTDLAH